MATKLDKEGICEAYEDVRDDNKPASWFVCKYEGNLLSVDKIGDNLEELQDHLGEDDRAFAFVRVITGDELSKRAKFALITWAGANVNGIKKAKLGPDKSLVKTVIKSFAVEFMANEQNEITLDVIKEALMRAGGANYGTGAAK